MKRILIPALLAATTGLFAASLDFGSVYGSVKPKLHGGGMAPRLKTLGSGTHEIEILRDLNMSMCRTHDLTLHDGAEPVVDFHHIFPIFSADENDPANYRFEATDALFAAITNTGMKVFYRLGHSAEGRGGDTSGGYFNNKVGNNTTSDYDKAARILSKIVAHFNEGWANGHYMGIEYWELWNEPTNGEGDWPSHDVNTYSQFFAKCVKQLKTDHPTIKVGGPALGKYDTASFGACLDACAAIGTRPDFISWHRYGINSEGPSVLSGTASDVRTYLNNKGYSDLEIGITEWNLQKNWSYGWADTGRLTMEGAAWCAGACTAMQYSPLDFAHWYGSGWDASYGVYNGQTGRLNKTYFALKMFGQVVKNHAKLVGHSDSGNYNVLGAIDAATLGSATKGCIFVADRSASSSSSVTISLSGLSGKTLSNVKCYVTDTTRDMAETTSYTLSTTSLTLPKSDSKEAVWLVTFDIR